MANSESASNLERSEKAIAVFLQYLVETGLRPNKFKTNTLELQSDLAPFLVGAIQWLIHEKIIHLENGSIVRDGEIMLINPMLSAKGFALLSSDFKFGDASLKLGDAVEKVSLGHSSFAKAGNFTGGLLASFIKSLG